MASMLRRVRDESAYRIRLVGLTLFGPATLDEEHDPVQALRRQYGKVPRRRRR